MSEATNQQSIALSLNFTVLFIYFEIKTKIIQIAKFVRFGQ